MRWTAREKDGQQEGYFCRVEPQKDRQTWAGSHCPRQRLEASLPIPTSIVSAESPSARPGNAKERLAGGPASWILGQSVCDEDAGSEREVREVVEEESRPF